MADRMKFRNSNWSLNTGPTLNSVANTAEAQLSVLMDLRDELQTLNRLLGCPNFTAVPAILRSIRRNTAKPRKKKRVRRA